MTINAISRTVSLPWVNGNRVGTASSSGSSYSPTVIVTNQTELNAQLAKSGAALDGQVIGVQYNATPYTISRSQLQRDYGIGGLVITQYGGTMPVFSSIAVDNCKNLRLHRLEVTSAATSGSLIYIYTHSNLDGIVVDSCVIHGTYQDPNGNYTVSAYPSTLRGIAYLTGGGGPSIKNITVQDCTIYDLSQGIELNKMLGAVSIVRNEIYNCYLEPIQLSGGVSVPTTCDVSWNVLYQTIALVADVNAPHGDFIQFQGASLDWTGISLIGNIMFKGSARSAGQGIFMDDMDAGKYFTANIKGNLIVQDTFNRGISIQQAKNSNIIGNTVVMAYEGQTASPGIFCGEYSDGGGCIVKNNVSKSFTVTSATTSNNHQISAQTATAYGALFAGTGFLASDTNTKEKVLANFSMKVGGSLDQTINIGAVGSGYVDYTARTINEAME